VPSLRSFAMSDSARAWDSLIFFCCEFTPHRPPANPLVLPVRDTTATSRLRSAATEFSQFHRAAVPREISTIKPRDNAPANDRGKFARAGRSRLADKDAAAIPPFRPASRSAFLLLLDRPSNRG